MLDMKILVTGAKGFIGKNLCLRLEETGSYDLIKIDRDSTEEQLHSGLLEADFVFHLAGINRPKNAEEFSSGNVSFTRKIVNILESKANITPIMLSSSTQASYDNAYGISKASAEKCVEQYGKKTGANYFIYRFPNVFGKWCRPNYNSFIATFCHNIANDVAINVSDPTASVTLIYIDDLCNEMLAILGGKVEKGYPHVYPEFTSTVGDVAELLFTFKKSRETLITEDVGNGLSRALYSTWLSYLRPEQFSYTVPSYSDSRGVFCEMLKTHSSGQFSFFTAHSGITRGGHYHHTKNEKFLVIKGSALFKFQHMVTHEIYELVVNSTSFQIVETVPGWNHDVTNIGDDELIVMLWANEIFDREAPDTISRPFK
jgi:UDP-2-acetamido-2,6-beta-L-arabino-hexul-4-ose reductase